MVRNEELAYVGVQGLCYAAILWTKTRSFQFFYFGTRVHVE